MVFTTLENEVIQTATTVSYSYIFLFSSQMQMIQYFKILESRLVHVAVLCNDISDE